MKTNEMEPYIRKTVAEMDADILALQRDIDQLTAARETIVNLYGGDTEVPPAPVKKANKGGAPAERPDAGTDVPRETGKTTQPFTANLITIAAGLAEPFSPSDLRAAANCDSKMAGNYILRWWAKGWLKRLEFGSYSRTPAFGSEAPVPTAETK